MRKLQCAYNILPKKISSVGIPELAPLDHEGLFQKSIRVTQFVNRWVLILKNAASVMHRVAG